ncbi:MAG: error-prone DNA polymerase [Candidatus Meridianibacter frigidus]|nr:MAG: error-prone DNA polymerase [Candidatus Eremiobacteraeota bacterium]
MAACDYAELHCWSNFTFLEGGSHPEELVARGRQAGLRALALTDRDGLYGAVRFSKAAKALELPAICGAELTFEGDEEAHCRPRVVLLAQDETGYANLVELISVAQMRGSKTDVRLRMEDFDGRTAGVIALSAGPYGLIERSLQRGEQEAARALARRFHELFGRRYFIELQHHLRPADAARIRLQLDFCKETQLSYVATNGVVYAVQEDAQLADVLLCVKHATTLGAAHEAQLLRPNSEYYLKTPAMMARLFADFPQAIANTALIAERCTFRLERLAGQFPLFPVPQREQSRQSYLRMLVYRGATERYGLPLSAKVERQLEYELGMIAKMDLAGYFLIVWDIVRAAAELGVLAQGRGSAANSAVCYALGITAVDPIGMELLFERFMSEGREEIPDIDIDFAHQDREKIIQYVYRRYGRAHAAMAAEVVTYRTRSAIRDIGKALGLSLDQVDKVVDEFDARESLAGATGMAEVEKKLPDSVAQRRDLDASTNQRASRLERPPLGHAHEFHGFDGKDFGDDPDPQIPHPVEGRIAEWLFAFCRRIDGFPRHMGIHSGGMVITRDPLVRVAPVEWATMRDRTIVQWDKDDLQDLGLIKIDLLGLGMLSLLREAFSLHARYQKCHPEQSRGELALHTIPPDDKPTYEMIQKADTIGVFQIESRAQQSMLPRMRPHCFYDIVMQVAIIRPGPIQGDMIHPFLRRRNGQEPVTYPHPKLKPILERTLGVPLFQEQGMRMAIEAAGFTPGQADQLRRAMGHKRSHERMREIYPRLVAGMVENGIDRQAAEQLFHMLEGFADYGFPESHAASFALLAYASAYVKCHFPAIFAAAILNVQPMGFYSTEVLVNDAKRHAVFVKPVEVNASEYYSHVDEEDALRLGFHLIRGLGEAQQLQLESAVRAGTFCDILEFAQRTQLAREALENLAIAGAFAPWFQTRRQAMWALRALDERETRGELGKIMEVDEPVATFKKLSQQQETSFDLWSTGVSPKDQPMTHFRTFLESRGVVTAAGLLEKPNHLVCRVGGLVITRQRPGTAKGFVFLTLEDETGLVNVIVRPDVYERYRRVIRQSMTLIIEGTLQREQGCIDVLAKRFWAFEAGELVAGMRSRNFH